MPTLRPWQRVLPGLVLAAVVIRFVPSGWCARHAAAWFDGNAERREELAGAVDSLVLQGTLSADQFHNAHDLFNGEWLFGSYFAAGVGFAQLALQHPEGREKNLERALRCADRLITPEVRAFDQSSWNEDPLDSLRGDNGHAAYLGYLNLVLSLIRAADPANRHADWNDRITAALTRRQAASSIGLLETYPHEVYPVDNAMVIGSIALHARATGAPTPAVVREWVTTVRSRYLDASTGLLIQAVSAKDGRAIDEPRGSGTALAVLPIHYADPALAADLYRAMRKNLSRDLLGFGAMREYRPGVFGWGDIDSGPVVFGIGLSVSGFALAGARMHGDEKTFRRLFASAHLFGAPARQKGGTGYISGGSLGNAILLAMLTAPRSEVLWKENP
jgi:hypothetical protein